jgi:hypothetical protein
MYRPLPPPPFIDGLGKVRGSQGSPKQYGYSTVEVNSREVKLDISPVSS